MNAPDRKDIKIVVCSLPPAANAIDFTVLSRVKPEY